MPYGIPKDKGGDSPKNDKKMEDCVSKVTGTNKRTGKPYTKGEKIAICKSGIFGKKKSKSEIEDEYNLEEAISEVNMRWELAERKLVQQGYTQDKANAMIEVLLAKCSYDFDLLYTVL